jgi:hypothetical protein
MSTVEILEMMSSRGTETLTTAAAAAAAAAPPSASIPQDKFVEFHSSLQYLGEKRHDRQERQEEGLGHREGHRQGQEHELRQAYLKVLIALMKAHPEYKFDLTHLSVLCSHFQRFTADSIDPKTLVLFKEYLTILLQHTISDSQNKPTHLHLSQLLFGIRYFIRPSMPLSLDSTTTIEDTREGEEEGDPIAELVGLYSKVFQRAKDDSSQGTSTNTQSKQVIRGTHRNQWLLMTKNLNAFYHAQFVLTHSTSDSRGADALHIILPFREHNNLTYLQHLHNLDTNTSTSPTTNLTVHAMRYHTLIHEISSNYTFTRPSIRLKSSRYISNELSRPSSADGFIDYHLLSPLTIEAITEAVWTHYNSHPLALLIEKYESKFHLPKRSKTGRYELSWNNYLDCEYSHVTIGYEQQRGFTREYQVDRPLLSIEFLPSNTSTSTTTGTGTATSQLQSATATSRLWSSSSWASATLPPWSMDPERYLEESVEDYLARKYTALPVFRYKAKLSPVSEAGEVQGQAQGQTEEVKEVIKEAIDEFYRSLSVTLGLETVTETETEGAISSPKKTVMKKKKSLRKRKKKRQQKE